MGPPSRIRALALCLSFPAGVLLHVMGDALGSVVVVITAIIFYTLPLKSEDPCNWQCYIDPSLTVVMVVIILSSAFPLIKETAVILLQMVPKGVEVEELSKSDGGGGGDLAALSAACASGQAPRSVSGRRLICAPRRTSHRQALETPRTFCSLVV